VPRMGTWEPLDFDFLVDLEPGRTLSDLGGLLMDLEYALGTPIDVVTEGCGRVFGKRCWRRP